MPIIRDFALPKAIGDLAIPAATDAFFVAFLASKDPQTNKPWCPDVVAALPTLESTFTGANKPQAAFVEVGQRPEYNRCIFFLVRGRLLTFRVQMERPQERYQDSVESQQRPGPFAF